MPTPYTLGSFTWNNRLHLIHWHPRTPLHATVSVDGTPILTFHAPGSGFTSPEHITTLAHTLVTTPVEKDSRHASLPH